MPTVRPCGLLLLGTTMRTNATLKIKCPGCGIQTGVAFRLPGLLDPAVVRFTCSGCESGLTSTIHRAKSVENPTPNSMKLLTKVTTASNLLVEMLREEREHRETDEPEGRDAEDAEPRTVP